MGFSHRTMSFDMTCSIYRPFYPTWNFFAEQQNDITLAQHGAQEKLTKRRTLKKRTWLMLGSIMYSSSSWGCSNNAVVTLSGKLAKSIDAERLQRWSTDEPFVLLFVGISLSEFKNQVHNDPQCHLKIFLTYVPSHWPGICLFYVTIKVTPICRRSCKFRLTTLCTILSSFASRINGPTHQLPLSTWILTQRLLLTEEPPLSPALLPCHLGPSNCRIR
ncbi:hypothetical protein ZWY2020_034046 [Hordeum vulgare]|nr:hypothetical protein ZWY2020_034046 [Hordeum vulgare]